MFEGFTLERVDVGDAELRVRYGGSGPPVLLLHGHPRTHVTWHEVAPVLAEQFTVVCPDLRGYGESSKPPTTPDHSPYSKRAMAGDCVALMHALGHQRFCAAGQDRGMTKPTAPPGAGSTAPCSTCGPPGTTWKNSTETRPPSGATGPATCAVSPSTAATTSPKKLQTS
jgi:pimeloyl-ACP methyl ester carboxylesterase